MDIPKIETVAHSLTMQFIENELKSDSYELPKARDGYFDDYVGHYLAVYEQIYYSLARTSCFNDSL